MSLIYKCKNIFLDADRRVNRSVNELHEKTSTLQESFIRIEEKLDKRIEDTDRRLNVYVEAIRKIRGVSDKGVESYSVKTKKRGLV